MNEPANAVRGSVRFAAYFLVFVLVLILLEVFSRAVLNHNDDLGRILNPGYSAVLERLLDPYEMVSPYGYAHWTLKPGFRADATSIVHAKEHSGKHLGADAFASDALPLSSGPNGIRVNSEGFRGPEIRPAHDKPRILMLGDSVTFGLANTAYPDVVRARLYEMGIDAEVINGGVEGYSVRNLEIELGRYLRLEPDIVTIFVGWNDIFSEHQYPDVWYMHFATLKLLGRIQTMITTLILDTDEAIKNMYASHTDVSIDDANIAWANGVKMPFIERAIKIAAEFQRSGSDVYLVTLPGLFVENELPSTKALQIGHLPKSINNPIVFAALTTRANGLLKEAAGEHNVKVLDLANWSLGALKPRDSFYLDSVHFTAKGLRLIGSFLAEQLCPAVAVSMPERQKCATGL